jgi:hypothetical protein
MTFDAHQSTSFKCRVCGGSVGSELISTRFPLKLELKIPVIKKINVFCFVSLLESTAQYLWVVWNTHTRIAYVQKTDPIDILYIEKFSKIYGKRNTQPLNFLVLWKIYFTVKKKRYYVGLHITLKGQCHEIFDPRFFSSIDHP